MSAVGKCWPLLDDRALQAARAEKAARIDSLRAQIQTWEAEQKSNEADLRRADAMRAEKILDDEDWEHVQYKLAETVTQVTRYKAEELPPRRTCVPRMSSWANRASRRRSTAW